MLQLLYFRSNPSWIVDSAYRVLPSYWKIYHIIYRITGPSMGLDNPGRGRLVCPDSAILPDPVTLAATDYMLLDSGVLGIGSLML